MLNRSSNPPISFLPNMCKILLQRLAMLNHQHAPHIDLRQIFLSRRKNQRGIRIKYVPKISRINHKKIRKFPNFQTPKTIPDF